MKRHPTIHITLVIFALLMFGGGTTYGQQSEQPSLLKSGDRLTLLGGTFIERLQTYGYFEYELAAAVPDLKIRNLGWSGDDVWGTARAVFGKPEDGFKRLVKDLELTKPTVILVAYGSNEAHAGRAGLAKFTTGLHRLLVACQATKARLILAGPHRYEQKPAPLPSVDQYNRDLVAYRKVIREAARSFSAAFINLDQIIPTPKPAPRKYPLALDQVTENGVHLTAYGHWRRHSDSASCSELNVPALWSWLRLNR